MSTVGPKSRDSAVVVSGDSDVAGKTTWNSGRGAIFLPNLGDTHRRCQTGTPDGRRLSNARLQACNDAQGNAVRAPEYLAPPRTVPVCGVSDAATGTLQLVGSGKSEARLFLRRGDTWTYVTDTTRATAAALRAAPVLTQHHLQRTEQALIVDGSRQDMSIPRSSACGFGGSPGAQDRPVIACNPGAVNGVGLTPTTYLAPKQWSPVVGGKDILAEAVTKAYAKVGSPGSAGSPGK
ncbi:hypothetical protein ACIBU0_02200 [Streptomyces sp. NPDC049627]|uniref:hypothetical protein n=1 Tax=Streptomyces sp. NPDC049627 TaxID=3365595 RepID=UPI0037874C6A